MEQSANKFVITLNINFPQKQEEKKKQQVETKKQEKAETKKKVDIKEKENEGPDMTTLQVIGTLKESLIAKLNQMNVEFNYKLLESKRK